MICAGASGAGMGGLWLLAHFIPRRVLRPSRPSRRSMWCCPGGSRLRQGGKAIDSIRTSERCSRPLLRRVDDAQHLDRVVHDLVDDAVGIAGHDALARAGYCAMPSHERELGQAVRGVEDRPDHTVGGGGAPLGIIGIRGAEIILRRRHKDNPHAPACPTSAPSTKSAGSRPSALNCATTSSMGLPSPARDWTSPSWIMAISRNCRSAIPRSASTINSLRVRPVAWASVSYCS